MKKVLLLLSMAFLLSGCATTSVSTGLCIDKKQKSFPVGIPKRVVVIPFEGDTEINLQATDQFSTGLSQLGFDVVDRNFLGTALAPYPEFEAEPTDFQGTGFLLSKDGLVVTNYHVIKDRSNIQVIFPEIEKTFSAEVLLKDINNDVVILKLSNFNFNSLFNNEIPYSIAKSSQVKLGQDIFTLGFPLEEVLGKKVKLSTGKINALYGLEDDPRLFQISNPIQPGNSGGALFNYEGELIGIVVASLNAKYFYEKADFIPQNVNFSVKSDYLINLITMLPEDNGIMQRETLLSGKKLEEQITLLSPFVATIIATEKVNNVIEDKSAKELLDFGIEGIFTGSVTAESSSMWVDSHLSIAFTDLQRGKTIWSVSAHDPRIFGWSMDTKSSIVYTTRQALKLLERDMLRAKK